MKSHEKLVEAIAEQSARVQEAKRQHREDNLVYWVVRYQQGKLAGLRAAQQILESSQ